MKRNIIILFLTLFVLSVFFIFIFLSYNQSVYYKDFGNPYSDLKFCFIAGVHGNEPAGNVALIDLINSDFFEHIAQENDIFIRVIPSVNEFGLDFNMRYQNDFFQPDINRTFNENGSHHLSKDILRLTKNMTLVIDFHEGWGFHRIHKNSLGSSLTATGDRNTRELAELIVYRLNSFISEDKYKFDVLDRICDIKNTLSCNFHSNS